MSEQEPLQEMSPELKVLIRQYFLDSPAASVESVAERFNASFSDVYWVRSEQVGEFRRDSLTENISVDDRKEVFSEIDTILGSRAKRRVPAVNPNQIGGSCVLSRVIKRHF